jgi:hypothetical protein
MNILIIGNGFDLAHGLPTRYTDFLHFCKYFQDAPEKINTKAFNENRKRYESYLDKLKSYSEPYEPPYDFKDVFLNYLSNLEEEKYIKFRNLVKGNFWYIWFNYVINDINDGWIDFETEISKVIKCTEHYFNESNNYESFPYKTVISSECYYGVLDKIFFVYSDTKEYAKLLFNDLNNLINVFGVYLVEVVANIEINLLSPDISKLKFEKVLSFNYTKTIVKNYFTNFKITQESFSAIKFSYSEKRINWVKYLHFIHGKANGDNDCNNLVLGIDEYLPEERKSNDFEFVDFKKWFQRIHKKTGNDYKSWIPDFSRYDLDFPLDPIADIAGRYRDYEEFEKENTLNISIFGHSLGETDKDILKEFIEYKYSNTTIYYLNEEDYKTKIINLAHILGQDKAIEFVGNGKVVFKKQQDMVKIEKTEELTEKQPAMSAG